MTAYSLHTKSIALVDETVALRRCALYHSAFNDAAISYPADLLGFNAVATWIRRHRVTVDVTTSAEFDTALSLAIDPVRIVVHRRDGDAALTRRAVNARVATFVVNSSQQIAILASSAERVQRVIIDATTESADALASDVLAHSRLELIGLLCRLEDPVDSIGTVKLRRLIAAISRISRKQGVVLRHVTLADLDFGAWCREPRVLRRIGEAIREVISEQCARYRYPRPELTLAPARAALLPARRALLAVTASSAV
jgi:hypothetical protein